MSELDPRALEEAARALIDHDPCISGHHPIHIEYKLPIARAAVTAYIAEAGDGWMPIETLPAEGLYLLASNAGPEHSVHHAGHFFEVWSARSYHAAINPNSTPAQRTLLREAQLVTHWRPLPAPPAAQEKK
jgi:hypothetical protein